jgi:hypothetical protein
MSRNLAKLIGMITLVISIATGSYAANAAPKCYGQYGSNGVTAGYYCEK